MYFRYSATYFGKLIFLLVLVGGCKLGLAQDKERPYVLKSLYFGGGSYRIDSLQVGELRQLVDSLPELKDYTITIHSHTDN
ncbi:MAG: hypothetical protein AAF616_09965, partial [Bacteroidota bacterium]